MSEKIIVTGGAGYIGSVLVRKLLQAGNDVTVIDKLLFGSESLKEVMNHPRFKLISADFCDSEIVKAAIHKADCVVHLAAIVGDAACNKFPEEAIKTMGEGSKTFLRLCEEAHVKKFIFASTCSNYGVMEGSSIPLNEDAALNPQSLYAELKVAFEQFLSEYSGSVSTAILRFSTVYGLSPRMRFDLTVNHFTRDLALGKPIRVFGKDQWRPYCHVTDLAQSVVMLNSYSPDFIKNKIYNVGDSTENYTKEMIVSEIMKQVPNGIVEFVDSYGNDVRNYAIDFARIKNELSFQVYRKVPDGIKEIKDWVESKVVPDLFDPIFVNA